MSTERHTDVPGTVPKAPETTRGRRESRHGGVRVLAALVLAGILTGPSPMAIPRLWAGQAGASQASIQERLKRVGADLFSRTDRIPEAIQELKSILALDPGSAEAHLLLGIAYRGAGTPELMGEAVAELRQALALNPGLVPARLYLAYLYLDLGRPRRSREELDAALAQAPGHPQLLALLGETERQLGNPTRSIDVLQQALKIDASFVQARYYLGLALIDLKRRDEAIKELEQVVQTGPKVVDAYVSLGTAYVEAGRQDEALKILTQAAAIDASRPDIRIQLARAYRSKGLLDKAEDQLARVSPGTVNPATSFSQYQQVESDLYLEQGLLKLQQGQLDAAAAAFQKVLDMDADHEAARRHLAEVRMRQKKQIGKNEPGARQ